VLARNDTNSGTTGKQRTEAEQRKKRREVNNDGRKPSMRFMCYFHSHLLGVIEKRIKTERILDTPQFQKLE
jgi:hypothetical protein